jgi:hypothetical protein
MQNLRAHTIIAIQSIAGFGAGFRFTQAAFLHQRVRAQLMNEIQAVLALT